MLVKPSLQRGNSSKQRIGKGLNALRRFDLQLELYRFAYFLSIGWKHSIFLVFDNMQPADKPVAHVLDAQNIPPSLSL